MLDAKAIAEPITGSASFRGGPRTPGGNWVARCVPVLGLSRDRPHPHIGTDQAREHRELAEAVLARDAELAVQRLAAHHRLTAQLCNLPRVR
jgi:hypothetical protein